MRNFSINDDENEGDSGEVNFLKMSKEEKLMWKYKDYQERKESYEWTQVALERELHYHLDRSVAARVSYKTKREIYRLHCEKPKYWTPSRLAVKFGVRKVRVEAWIQMYRYADECAEEWGNSWNQIYDLDGNVINLEEELEKQFPNLVADRIDDRWLLRQRRANLNAVGVIADEVNQAKLQEAVEKSRPKWLKRIAKMRKLNVPESQLPDKIWIPKPFKLEYKMPNHNKKRFLIVDSSPEYTDFTRPMFLVEQDGTVNSVGWEERRKYIMLANPTHHHSLSLYDESTMRIDAPAEYDAPALSTDDDMQTHGLEHDRQEVVATEMDRVVQRKEELESENTYDDENIEIEQWHKEEREIESEHERDEAHRIAYQTQLLQAQEHLEEYFSFEDGDDEM
eukprot:CAMPEP_0201479348 /NCGR_PEP_ID=MMETSP0151_2-20130828/4053_1 /ASSEMBLY_ACC=CAM_ASM_000257 /TAXON_ID=200890 /ORGANISM="Paramoeba atlantica, Strain 621/1 / CCAP 1560/9" /LENGTH=394 /DNA_ID=CAMNT_0047860797 /DNA_START=182 /DNA_END=1366 /DNA_ORIENTATION=+